MRTYLPGCLVCALAMALGACGAGDGLRVELDPDLLLLRDDLPPPEARGQALHAGPAWGRWGFRPAALELPGLAAHRPQGVLRDGAELSQMQVRLAIDPAAGTIAGEADVSITADGAQIDEIEFYLTAAAVDSVQSEPQGATHSHTGSRLTVTPSAPLADGESIDLDIAWHDADVEVEVEFFPEGFKKDVLVGIISETSTFFTFGYWYFPRLVGPETISNIGFEVTYPASKTLVMSGELTDSQDNGDGTRTDSWVFDKPARWSLSLALAAYELVQGTCGDTTIEVYGIPGESVDHFPIVPQTYVPVMESICEEYARRFGEPAFDTIRLAGVDERFTNGYSSPGLIIVPNYTLDDDDSGSFPERDFYLAHEVSHQWWGNDVFNPSVDIWLTEGLADYSAAAYLAHGWGEEESLRAWLADSAYLLSHYAEGGEDHPLVPENPADMQPVIYYLKGAWVLRMLESVIGEEALTTALAGYRTANRFSVAGSEDFMARAESAHGEDLGWFFEQWLHGTGVMSLEQVHAEKNGSVELTVTQHETWTADPPTYYEMPLDLRLARGGKKETHTVIIEDAEAIFVLDEP